MASLDGKRILLGVTGGIAAYKSPDLVRRLKERGADVQVVMTHGAQQFVTPMTFQAVSGREVRAEIWDPKGEAAMGHIELARWADVVLVAPATADFIARLAHGQADDLLSTVCLAAKSPLALAPAMNQQMWANTATQNNIATLRGRGLLVWGPGSGDQACGDVGEGRMLEPLDITARVEAQCGARGPLVGKNVIVTAGPTRERIDPVRFISNRSSGKMGFAVAAAARAAGADVLLIAGPVSLPTPSGVQRIDVESAADMHAAVMRELPGCRVFISTAAVADYRPTAPQDIKIKKESAALTIELTRTTDILATVAAQSPRPFVVGFAAETNDVEAHARGKLLNKKLDMIAANEVGDTKVFDCEDNSLTVLWSNGRAVIPTAPKSDVARSLIALIIERLP